LFSFLFALFLSKILKISYTDSLRLIFCCSWCSILCPKVPHKKKDRGPREVRIDQVRIDSEEKSEYEEE
jgi:hypothetical protein